MQMENSEPKASIRGSVLGETGKPVGGVKIRCDGQEATTLFDGSYAFCNLEQGTYEIRVSLEGYSENPQKVTVQEGEELNHDITLQQATGEGRIWGCVVSEETGRPPATGGTVFIGRQTFNRATPINPLNGRYEFTDLPPGTYHLWTAALEHEDTMVTVELKDGEVEENMTIKRRAEEVPWG
jgi:hypothetical protein